MPYVRAALWNGIDHASQRSAVLGFEAARLDLNFLDEVRLKVLADAAVLNIGGVNAINEINVLGIAGAVNLETAHPALPCALQRLLPGTRRERNDRLEGAQFRNVLQHLLGYVGLHLALGDVDHGRFRRNTHFLSDAAYLHLEIERWQGAGAQFQIVLGRWSKARGVYGDAVNARRQLLNVEEAARIGRRGLLSDQCGAGHFHGSTGNHSALRVLHRSLYSSCGLLCQSAHGERQYTDQEAKIYPLAHDFSS